ncbi:hypothetical protein [Idiomarina sp.]|uniref:hypothetical protein n=1 Tax=Idiomarina sp. TaxID=1874361 RepID=UPI002603F4CB|nr:hypothetical protein [Idiomarina sp.]
MKIDGSSHYMANVQQTSTTGVINKDKAQVSEPDDVSLPQNTDPTSGSGGPNFQNMTIHELEEWRNEQHRNGVELPEGISFTISSLSLNNWQINSDTGDLELKDQAELDKKYNMYDQAQKGVDFYLGRGDSERAQTWQNLIEFMSSQQAQAKEIDILV